MITSDSLNELATALALAQGEIKDADKDSVNPHLKSKYADLASVLQAARPILSKNGLSLTQGVAFDSGAVHVTSRLLHKSGQWVESMISIPVAKADAQGIGSATTYGRRYGASAIIGISQDDDDGEAVKTPKKKETGTSSQYQVPSSVSQAMIARFNQVGTGTIDDEATMKALTSEYPSLTPAEQAQVLPAAKAARTRLDGVKPPTQ